MAGVRYIADPAACLVDVQLDGLTAVYHRPSGMTHILAAPAPQLIEALAGAPASLAELQARIAERFDVEDPAALEVRLAELEAAGLVSRI